MNKILIITPSLNAGGAEKVAVNLANEWSRLGHEVLLLTILDINYYSDEVDSRVSVFSLHLKKIRYSFLRIRDVIVKFQPDYILSVIRTTNILTGLAMPRSFKGVLAMREANTLHGVRRSNLFRKLLMLAFMKLSYMRASVVIANSPDTLLELKSYGIGKDKITFIPNPVVTDELLDQSKVPPPHHWLSNNEIKVILGVGRLTDQKDFETLIRSFKLLSGQNHNVRLIILGKGYQEPYLKSLCDDLNIADLIDFVGVVNNPSHYMKHADVFVSTSKWEGFGNVIVESLACGTPVIVTRCSGGPQYIIKNGEYGNLADVGDYKSIAKMIEEQISIDTEHEKLIKRSLDFSVHSIADHYLKEMISHQS